ncbi:MAG: SOS response-associated peptidase [Dermabacter sp.]|nr:SOS response-associated peptidase [Dermabacter sp.]
MCGRFAFFQEIEPLIDDLDAVDLTPGAFQARFNIPPTTPIYVVTEGVERDSGELVRALRVARWGLLPPFAKDLAASQRTFNARREALIDKPSFRGSLKKYRAIIPMSGYYEWRTPPPPSGSASAAGRAAKQPYFIRDTSGAPLYGAALVSWWKGPGAHDGPAASTDGAWLLSATLITKAAEGHLADIHDRMPVFLDTDGAKHWLDVDAFTSGAEAHAWIGTDESQLGAERLEAYPVDRAVGRVGLDGEELIRRVEPSATNPPEG